MRIHRVHGRDLRDALEKAREAHGEGAVVLSQEAATGGGVTVSVTGDAPPGRTATGDAPVLEPGQRDVLERLRAAGASHELADAVLEDVRASGVQGAFAIDRAAAAIAGRMRIASSPRPGGGQRVIAFVGPSGSGKTTTVAKLADRLTRSGRRVAVATVDSYRPGGTELLRAECERLGVAFHACRYREDLPAILAAEAGADAILFDTRGRSPRDADHLGQLASLLADDLVGRSEVALTTYLVVPAATSRESLEEVQRGFARTSPDAAIVTKVDETRRTAVALESVQAAGLPVVFLCTGQEVATDLYRATPDRLADLVLGGRVR